MTHFAASLLNLMQVDAFDPLVSQSLSGWEQLTNQKTPTVTRSSSLPPVPVSHQLAFLPSSHSHSPVFQLLFKEMGHFRDWFFNTRNVTFTRAQMYVHNLSLTVSVTLMLHSIAVCASRFFFFFYISSSNTSLSVQWCTLQAISFYQLAHENGSKGQIMYEYIKQHEAKPLPSAY